jgi:lysophospholipase L1-like esterase
VNQNPQSPSPDYHDPAFGAERDDPHALSPERAAELLRGHSWKRYAVLGDSLSEGVLEEREGYRPLSWAARVDEALTVDGTGPAYLNLGHRGLFAAQVRETQLAQALAFEPDLATVCCGGNDMFERRFDRDAVQAEIDAMVAALRDAGATVFVFGLMNITAAVPKMAPYRARIQSLNERVAAVADKHSAVYVDLWDHPAAGDIDMYSTDLLHMSSRGHALIAATSVRALAASLNDA